MILAIETSCDDTCAAVLSAEGEVRANIVSPQLQHGSFGGVVPEIAARHHLELINPVIDAALEEADITIADIELIAVTQGPGLIGALLIGVVTAKALACVHKLPLAPVDHLHGHIASNFIGPNAIEPPFLCLIASGGHTLLVRVIDFGSYELLGTTLDDAAGEAFDKGARLLGLSYPGGAALSQLAHSGDADAFDFPTAQRVTGLDCSFAGLKTALLYKIRDLGEDRAQQCRSDLAASFEKAIVETLVTRVERALAQYGDDHRLAVCGGVAANTRLRARLSELVKTVHFPPVELCTDNAAMIASAARFTNALSFPAYLGLDVFATAARPSLINSVTKP